MFRMPAADKPGKSLGAGIELWTGLHMATKIGEGWKPLINLDGKFGFELYYWWKSESFLG